MRIQISYSLVPRLSVPPSACHNVVKPIQTSKYHSHTLENRSSLAPKPPAEGLVEDCAGGLAAAGVTGAALLQLPKSSSAAIFGGALEMPPPPMFDEFVEPPQDEKSLVVVIAGDLVSVFGFEVVDGSGVAHALLEPQGSSLEKPENELELTAATGADLGAGCETGAGAERLKAELIFEDGGAGFEAIVGCDGNGSENSKRSLGAPLAGGLEGGTVVDGKLKSPGPFDALGVRNGRLACVVSSGAFTGFGAGLEPVPKKPLPLKGGGEVIEDVVKLVRWLGDLLKLANGSVLGTGCACCDGGDVVGGKLRPLNASSRPDDCCVVGACMPPKMSWLSCCGCDCVRGAEAYRERMDCLRSGLEGAVAPTGVEVPLEGLDKEVDGGPPKKSNPKSESPGF